VPHPYYHYESACICGQPPGHHDHTGTHDDCPCSRCGFERDNDTIFGRSHRWLYDYPLSFTVSGEAPASFSQLFPPQPTAGGNPVERWRINDDPAAVLVGLASAWLAEMDGHTYAEADRIARGLIRKVQEDARAQDR
jgi:hypothetical protein